MRDWSEKSSTPLLPYTRSDSTGTHNGKQTVSSGVVSDWMSNIDDAVPISGLSIPGTHDSAAFTNSWPFISTQTLNIREQLDSGIRYFDFRLGLRNDVLQMVHGPSYLGLSFDVVLANMYEWLEAHNREALIVQLKQDREDERSTLQFSQAVTKAILAHAARWRTANTTPTLGELRGKMQLLRRFVLDGHYAYGINVTQWEDNPEAPFTIHTWHGVQITIQDHYKLADPAPLPSLIDSKGGDVSRLLNFAADDISQWHWYINFTSSFEFNLWYQIPPKTVATGGWSVFRWVEGINLRLRDTLKLRPGKRRLGIIAMDFPELATTDLIEMIIASNFESSESGLATKKATPSWMVLLALVLTMIMVAVMIAMPQALNRFLSPLLGS